uniref:Uncharacterized protein n=1 Tax=Naja naja TaxID=35670 RepID=A0A8C6YMH7_NAJNA
MLGGWGGEGGHAWEATKEGEADRSRGRQRRTAQATGQGGSTNLVANPLRLPSVRTTCSGLRDCTVVCTLVRLGWDMQQLLVPPSQDGDEKFALAKEHHTAACWLPQRPLSCLKFLAQLLGWRDSKRGKGGKRGREKGRRKTKGGGKNTERHMEDNPCGWEEELKAKNKREKNVEWIC